MVSIKIKTCTKCNENFSATDEFFYKKSGGKFGLHAYCKKCCSEKNRKYYSNNRRKILKGVKRYRQTAKGRELRNAWNSKWKKTDVGKIANKRYKSSDKGRESARRSSLKRYYKNRLSSIISSHIYQSLKENKANRHCFDVLPYNLNDLKNHLGRLWLSGMTWENHSRYGWHIDHIKPVSYFDGEKMKDVDSIEFQECWSLENLQPLWAEQNLKKGAKLTEDNGNLDTDK